MISSKLIYTSIHTYTTSTTCLIIMQLTILCSHNRSLNDFSDYNPRGGKAVRRMGGGGFKGGAGGGFKGGNKSQQSRGNKKRIGKEARLQRRANAREQAQLE